MSRKTIITAVIAVAAIGGLIFAYREMSAERAREREREKPVVAESRASRAASGEVTLTLDDETQKRIALKTEPLTAATLAREAKAFGRVLDPAPLLALVNEFVAAGFTSQTSAAELEAARKLRQTEQASLLAAAKASVAELARLKTLRAQDNASERALQTAEAAAQKDQSAFESQQAASDRAIAAAEAALRRDQMLVQTLRDKLALGTGRAVVEQNDLPAFVRMLAAGEAALVRLDLPAGEAMKSPPTGARILGLSDESAVVEAPLLGAAASIDPQTQGQGFLFLLKGGAVKLAPNAGVTGFLKLPGAPLAGVVVPRAAVVRVSGGGAVYVQTADKTFTRRPLALEQPTEAGWFVSHGFTPGERVVVSGAQTLLSEELKGQMRMKD